MARNTVNGRVSKIYPFQVYAKYPRTCLLHSSYGEAEEQPITSYMFNRSRDTSRTLEPSARYILYIDTQDTVLQPLVYKGQVGNSTVLSLYSNPTLVGAVRTKSLLVHQLHLTVALLQSRP